MEKRKGVIIALVCSLCAVAVLSSVIYFLGFPRSNRYTRVTLSELESDPESWLGKRVCVSGTLRCGLMYIPEAIPPYNCVLSSFNNTESVGVQTRVYNEYDDRNVTVFGIFTQGRTGPLIVRWVNYIHAESVLPIT